MLKKKLTFSRFKSWFSYCYSTRASKIGNKIYDFEKSACVQRAWRRYKNAGKDIPPKKKLQRQDSKIATPTEFKTWWFLNRYSAGFEQLWEECCNEIRERLKASERFTGKMLGFLLCGERRYEQSEQLILEYYNKKTSTQGGKLLDAAIWFMWREYGHRSLSYGALEEFLRAARNLSLVEPETLTITEEMRVYEGWSREELAEKSGVSLAEIKRIENGNGDISRENLTKIAKIFPNEYPNRPIMFLICDIYFVWFSLWKKYQTFPTHNLFCQDLEKTGFPSHRRYEEGMEKAWQKHEGY